MKELIFGDIWFTREDFDYCMCGSHVDHHNPYYDNHSPVPFAYHYFRPNILMRLFPALTGGFKPRMGDF